MDSLIDHNDKQFTAHAVDIESKDIGHVPPTQADAALEYLRTEDVATFSEVDEKRLVRKIDRMIVPLMWAIYFLQYQDKILSQLVDNRLVLSGS